MEGTRLSEARNQGFSRVKHLLDLISKEELILYPTSLKLISDAEFEEMKHGDREIGFFLIDMPGDAPKAAAASTNAPAGGDFMNDLATLLGKYGMGAKATDDDDRVLDVAEGKLTLEQINLLFETSSHGRGGS